VPVKPGAEFLGCGLDDLEGGLNELNSLRAKDSSRVCVKCEFFGALWGGRGRRGGEMMAGGGVEGEGGG